MTLTSVKWAIRFVIAVCFALVSPLYAGDEGIVSPDKVTVSEISLRALQAGPFEPKLWYYEDSDHLLGLDDVRALLATGQFKSSSEAFNAGFSTSRFWYYFEVNISPYALEPGEDQDLYIEIEHPLIDNLVFTQLTDGRIDQEFDVGDHYKFSARPVRSTNFVLPVKLPVGHTVGFLAKVDTVGAARFPVKIWLKERYLDAYGKSHILNGLFFGVVFLLAIYNCLIGITIRDVSHLYYFLFFTSSGLFYAAYGGYGFQYLWPGSPYLNEISIPVFAFLSLGFGNIFACAILELRSVSPKLAKLLTASGGLWLFVALASFVLPYLTAINLTAIGSLVTVVLLTTASVVCWKKGQPQVWHFILGSAAVLVGLVLFDLANKGYIAVNGLTLHANQLGIVVQALFFSLALGDRIDQTIREKEEIELRAKRELEQKNSQLNMLLGEVKRGSEMKDQFLATISHELRTPMNGLESSLEMLGEKINSPEQLQHYTIAKYSANNMTRTVDRVLELYELQTDRLVLQKSPTNLFALAAKAIQNCAEEANKKNLRFQLEMDALPQRYLVLDGARLQTLLVQLVDNAVKFTQEGGIHIKLDCIKSGTVQEPLAYTLRIIIADTGIGIDAKDQQLIFEKFRQVDGGFARKFGGMGIGLTLVSTLLDKMDGKIGLQSTPGTGSTFTLEIPVVLGDELPLSAGESNATHHKARVLIVEDNTVNLLMLSTIVKKLGYETETASDGQQAIAKAMAQVFDCILMDCQMPVMDGFNATLAIRNSNSVNSTIPIIAVSANSAGADRQHCYDVGMNDFVKKPINKDIVAEKICKWLNAGQAESVSLSR